MCLILFFDFLFLVTIKNLLFITVVIASSYICCNIYIIIKTQCENVIDSYYSLGLNDQSTSMHSIPQVKVVDVTCIIPPNNCKPQANNKWVSSRIVLLTKSGWLYEADIENCDIISKIYIPTKEYASNLCDIDSKKNITCS